MQITKSKKVPAVLGAGAVAVAGSGVAFAYWSAGGSGSSTATATTTTNNLTVSGTGWANIAPGATGAKTFTVNVHNPNTYSTRVEHVKLDPAYGAGSELSTPAGNGITTSDAGCLSSWFSTDVSSITVGQNVAGSGDTGNLAFGTL